MLTRDAMVLERGSGWVVRWYDHTGGKYPYYRGEKFFHDLPRAKRWRDQFLEVGMLLVWQPWRFDDA